MDPARMVAMALLGGLALWGLAFLLVWVDAWWRERRSRERRRLQVRKADRWWHDVEGQAALAAMRRVADDADRRAR